MNDPSSDELADRSTFLVFDGHVHTPYFIFVRHQGRLSDAELLARLGLTGFSRRRMPAGERNRLGRGLLMANDAEWTHVMDNWRYQLWSMQDIRQRITRLATEHDVFTCSVGEADDSYDFEYHQGGRLVRKREVVPDRWPSTVKLETEIGDPLPIEATLWKEAGVRDELWILLQIAASLGIETRPEHLSFRYYSDDGAPS